MIGGFPKTKFSTFTQHSESSIVNKEFQNRTETDKE